MNDCTTVERLTRERDEARERIVVLEAAHRMAVASANRRGRERDSLRAEVEEMVGRLRKENNLRVELQVKERELRAEVERLKAEAGHFDSVVAKWSEAHRNEHAESERLRSRLAAVEGALREVVEAHEAPPVGPTESASDRMRNARAWEDRFTRALASGRAALAPAPAEGADCDEYTPGCGCNRCASHEAVTNADPLTHPSAADIEAAFAAGKRDYDRAANPAAHPSEKPVPFLTIGLSIRAKPVPDPMAAPEAAEARDFLAVTGGAHEDRAEARCDRPRCRANSKRVDDSYCRTCRPKYEAVTGGRA